VITAAVVVVTAVCIGERGGGGGRGLRLKKECVFFESFAEVRRCHVAFIL
jgi:hypothetical protein